MIGVALLGWSSFEFDTIQGNGECVSLDLKFWVVTHYEGLHDPLVCTACTGQTAHGLSISSYPSVSNRYSILLLIRKNSASYTTAIAVRL